MLSIAIRAFCRRDLHVCTHIQTGMHSLNAGYVLYLDAIAAAVGCDNIYIYLPLKIGGKRRVIMS